MVGDDPVISNRFHLNNTTSSRGHYCVRNYRKANVWAYSSYTSRAKPIKADPRCVTTESEVLHIQDEKGYTGLLCI
jgi:hypothetical protein